MGQFIYDFIPRDNIKILGQLFYEKRMEKGYSLRGLAQSANVSASMISDLENGKPMSNIDMLNYLFKALDLDLLIDEQTLKKAKEIIEDFYNAIYYKSIEQIEKTYDQIKNNMQTLKLSLLFVEVTLVEETYLSAYQKEKVSDALSEHELWYPNLSKMQKQRYNLIRGINEYQSGRIDEALYYLHRNLSLNMNEKTHGITLSYLAEVLGRSYKMHSAIELGKIATSIHTKANNIPRKIHTDLMLIKNYIEIGSFKNAEEILNNMKYVHQYNGDDQEVFDRLNTLEAYLLFRKEEFEASLLYLTKVKTQSPQVFYNLGNVYYHLGNKEKATYFLKKNIKAEVYEESLVYYSASYLFLYYIGETVEKNYVEQSIEYLLRNKQQLQHFHFLTFIQKMIGKYFYKNEQLKDLYELFNEFLDFVIRKDEIDT